MKKLLVLAYCLLSACLIFAQKTFPQDAVYDQRDGHYAFTNATIYTNYNTKIEGGTLIIKEGKVVSAGKGVSIPKDAVTIDLNGKFIYPSFIDLYVSYGLPKPVAIVPGKWKPQEFSNKKGPYSWNEALRPEYNTIENFTINKDQAKGLRKQGFGAVLSHQMNGISRGTGSLILLGEERSHLLIVKDKASNHFSFSKGKSTQGYPSSLMGAIALLRQTYMDAEWYKNHGSKEEYNQSLQAWNNNKSYPQFFEVRDWQEALRATKVGQEFGLKYVMKGTGDEYKRAKELKATGQPFIIPVNYPKVYDVEDPYAALQIHIHQMKHWELAPNNAQVLSKEGIEFAFTTHGLEDKGDFLKNIKESIDLGLSEEAALKALTATPAKIINASNELGSLERGKRANFIITSGNVFDKKTKIYHNWVNGKAHVIKNLEAVDVLGAYNLTVGRTAYNMEITGTEAKPKWQLVIDDSTKVDVSHTLSGNLLSLSFELTKKEGFYSLSGLADGTTWTGKGTDNEGNWLNWTASRTGDVEDKKDDKKKEDEKDEDKEEDKSEPGPIVYPFMPYGNTSIPKQETFLIQNATVWTNEKEGILEETDVLIQNGKIAKVGKGLSASGCKVIDAKGKHLTSGIIDEHSHICISRGVNEGTQNSSAEVNIRDVVNSEDVNMYRQLAGGVTMAQLLHGSANPIGGQAALIKMRWGFTPEQIKFANAPKFIKFALGENVKQSNWGEDYSVRFPQTRMGVEQVFVDHFTRAKEYSQALKSGKPVRRDLELDAIKDIIESKMFITCHSYVQSEINMLMKTAEAFDFKINTFTHILEGYKIADKMKAHGAGGSTFSDWWAYKYEVIDAIAYNGALLNEQGIVTAFNSDDAEMGRRLNQEAAKAVMYGNASEEDAWKFVTLNPAKLLRVDDKVGSIKVGKDADLVVWSDNPLSIYAQAEHTFVDGIRFYNKEEDLQKRAAIKSERTRLVQKLIQAKKDGKPTQKVEKKEEHLYHCDHIEDEIQD